MKRFLSIFLLSLIASFTIAGTEVYAPSLKSPANNFNYQMPNGSVSWYPIVGSVGLMYQLQIDTTPNFNSPELLDTTQVLLAGYKTHELLFGQKYYWHVRAIDLGQTSSWSDVWQFKTFNIVKLTKPLNNANNDTLAPYQVLIWSNQVGDSLPISATKYPITGIRYYDIQTDTTLHFNSPQLHSNTVAYGTNFCRISNLKFNTKYYWRVRARHNLDTSNWSWVWNFTVVKYIVPTAPANNAVDQTLDARLTWKYLKGMLGYEYQLATDTTFTNVIASSEVDTNFVLCQFTRFGTKYYWRVRGRHISDTMQWCPRFAFTTIDLVKLTTPTNNATNIAVRPILKWTKQTGIVMFQLQVDVTPDFSSSPLFINAMLADTLVQFALTKNMKYSTTYYWRMRAFSDSQLPDTSGWSPVWNFITLTTGIGENGLLTSNIYPNPASGKVNIKLEVGEPVTMQVSVVDLLGSTFINEEFELTSGINYREINIANLSKGIYIVRLNYNGDVVNHKLIVDR